MPENMHYSHKVLQRHRQAERDLKPLVAAYTHAMNTVFHAGNLEVQLYSFENRTRIKMSEPRYQFPEYNSKYCAALKKHDKDLTELDCWLTSDGYAINGQNRYDLSFEEICAVISARLNALGPEFRQAFHAYLQAPSVDTSPKNEIADTTHSDWKNMHLTQSSALKTKRLTDLFKRAQVPTNIEREINRDLVPLLQAYRYALAQDRQDVGNVHVHKVEDGYKIWIALTDKAESKTFEIFADQTGYMQNPMAPLSNQELSCAHNKAINFDELLDLIEKSAKQRGDDFWENYNSFLQTKGAPKAKPVNRKPRQARP